MKKVQTNKTKKLTLGKMTVAKLQMNKQQMKAVYGGDNTSGKPKPKPASLLPGNENCTNIPITIVE